MIVKPQFIPMRLLADQALLNHLPLRMPERAGIEEEIARLQAGWRGEQELGFHLTVFQDAATRIFYDLHLEVVQQTFQIDCLLLTSGFTSILEAKNYLGTLNFLPDGQMIRTVANRREGFPNPVVQVQRHGNLLQKWYSANQFPALTIEPQIAITNPATIIENPANLRSVYDWVTHAEQIPSRINQFLKKYPDKINTGMLSMLEQQLLHAHTDPTFDVLSRFKIHPNDLQHGIRCDRCNHFTMQRTYGTWICCHCGYSCNTAHVPMILDYFLLLGPTMSNSQCRGFLKIEDRLLVNYLLKNMGMIPSGNGHGRGRYYERPSQEYYHNYHMKNKAKGRSSSYQGTSSS